jgi:hypothetical protein
MCQSYILCFLLILVIDLFMYKYMLHRSQVCGSQTIVTGWGSVMYSQRVLITFQNIVIIVIAQKVIHFGTHHYGQNNVYLIVYRGTPVYLVSCLMYVSYPSRMDNCLGIIINSM